MGLANQGIKIRFPNKCRTELYLNSSLGRATASRAGGRKFESASVTRKNYSFCLGTPYFCLGTPWWLDLFLVLSYVSCSAQIPESRTFFGRVWGD